MAHSFNHKNVPQDERKIVRDARRARRLAASTKRSSERDGWSFMDTSFVSQSAGRIISRRS